MPKKYLKDFYWKDYFQITIGLLMYSLGVIAFIKPAGIVMGALTGVGLLLDYATQGGIPISETVLVVNVILLLFALKPLGLKFLVKTIYGVALLTFFLFILGKYIQEPAISGEPLLAGVIGGMLCGAGVGLVFSSNGSTGGTDIVIAIVNKYKDITFGRGMMLCDFFIISASYFVFKDINVIIQGLIVMGVMTYVIDLVIDGSRQSVQMFIVSKKHDTIATAINTEMKRGCTMLDGMGWYTKDAMKVIMVMVKRTEALQIIRLAKSVDEDAFITQTAVKSVYGKGFDQLRKKVK